MPISRKYVSKVFKSTDVYGQWLNDQMLAGFDIIEQDWELQASGTRVYAVVCLEGDFDEPKEEKKDETPASEAEAEKST